MKGRAKFTLRLFMDEGNFKHLCLDNSLQPRAGRVCLKWPSIFILNKLSFRRFADFFKYIFPVSFYFFVLGASVSYTLFER